MVRYLSAEWFQRLRDATAPRAGTVQPAATDDGASGSTSTGRPLVLRQIVTGGPDGDVRYDVVVHGDTAEVDPDLTGRADLTFTTDYTTAAAIASGRTSTHAALSEGLLRVSGNAASLAERAGDITPVDPVPAALRADTEY